MSLSHPELVRYARHLSLDGVGLAGQERLKASRVLVIGAGGLGSPAALYLAAAGVGTIGLVDFDTVDVTNLQRQILHGTSTIGLPKLTSAESRLSDLNPHVALETFPVRLSAENASDIVRRFDIVLDGSDNFPTRYLINDACVLLGKPYVYGSIFQFEGQVSIFAAKDGPCYRCLFPEPPPPGLVPNCAEGGVLGVLPGIIGSLQALEAIKWILGVGESLVGRLVLFDALKLKFRELSIRRDSACVVCGQSPTITRLIDYDAFCGVTATSIESAEISPAELEAIVISNGRGMQLIDVRESWEWDIAHIDGSRLIPLGTLPTVLRELDSHREVVTLCHRGARSLAALQLLKGAGFSRVRSLHGGIDAWAAEVAPGMSRY